ncbi:MAG: hypothetical protein RLZZ392_162 [Pseudomonadota bacterium]
MAIYQRGKIYTIRSHQTNKVYVGSTVNLLCKRMDQHRAKYRQYLNGTHHFVSSFTMLKYEDAYIELHVNYPSDSKEELHRREGEVIREFGEMCINMVIPGRTKKEYCEDNKEKIKEKNKKYWEANKEKLSKKSKEYREDNKEALLEYQKQYREENKDIIKEKQKKYCEVNKNKIKENKKKYMEENKDIIKEKKKEYYENNKDRIKERDKKYREDNKEKIKERKSEKVECECGSFYTKQHMSRHKKTKKHQDFENNKNKLN